MLTLERLIGSQALYNYLQPIVFETVSDNNVSEQCAKSLFRYIHGVKEWEPWAIQMFDATGKPPSGFLSGTKMDFGSYDQCLEIKVKQNKVSTSFKGQYCMLDVKTPLISPMTMKTPNNKSYLETYGVPPTWIYDMIEEQEGMLLTFGLYMGACLPSSCSEREIYNILTHVSEPAGIKISVSDCHVDEPKKWPTSAIIATCMLVALLALCLFGTFLDIQDKANDEDDIAIKDESFNRKCLKAFSLYTNTKHLFDIKRNQTSMDFICGLRVFLCVWVIFSHLIFYTSRWKENKFTNWNQVLRSFHLKFSSIVLENGFLCLGNFFHLSGFLMTYILWRKLEKSGGHLNTLQVLIYKYCRLTPIHLFLIIISFVMPVLHHGPIWNSTWEHENGKCEKFGWVNLFTFQNFLQTNQVCWIHTWFLGALFQIQIISLLLMVFTFRNPRKGVLVGFLLLVGCFMRDYSVSLQNNYPLQSIKKMKSMELPRQIINNIYMKPFHHFGAHLFGMLLGWYVYKFKDHKLHSKYHVLGWIFYGIGSILVLYTIRFPINDLRFAALYNSTRNTLWALCFSWLVYSCSTGSAGILNQFLSWKTFLPLSQISYAVYLTHPLVLFFREASLRDRVEQTLIDVYFEMPAVVLFSFILGYVVHISVEVPFNNLFDLCLKNSSTAPEKDFSVKNGIKKNNCANLQANENGFNKNNNIIFQRNENGSDKNNHSISQRNENGFDKNNHSISQGNENGFKKKL